MLCMSKECPLLLTHRHRHEHQSTSALSFCEVRKFPFEHNSASRLKNRRICRNNCNYAMESVDMMFVKMMSVEMMSYGAGS